MAHWCRGTRSQTPADWRVLSHGVCDLAEQIRCILPPENKFGADELRSKCQTPGSVIVLVQRDVVFESRFKQTVCPVDLNFSQPWIEVQHYLFQYRGVAGLTFFSPCGLQSTVDKQNTLPRLVEEMRRLKNRSYFTKTKDETRRATQKSFLSAPSARETYCATNFCNALCVVK